MSVAFCEIGKDAPSACLPPRLENPHRLVSLREVVEKFEVTRFLIVTHCLGSIEGQLDQLSKDGKGAHLVETNIYDFLRKNVANAYDLCKKFGLPDAALKIAHGLKSMENNQMNISALWTELRNIREAVMFDSAKQWFIRISRELSPLVDQKYPFGEEVADAFPSARADLTEAGNCLAVESATACVFHLMRAAEVALRALAKDRRVSYPDSSLNARQVGDLLAPLESKLLAMRQTDWRNWPSKDIKDAQIAFYHRAIAEFRDFNEAWRKHMAHAHEGAFYNTPSALGIMKHVETLMRTLSPKVSEVSIGPEFWNSI